MSAIEEREIDRLESEIAALRADLDRLTKGTWSKEIARLSAANAALRQERDEALRIIARLVHVFRGSDGWSTAFATLADAIAAADAMDGVGKTIYVDSSQSERIKVLEAARAFLAKHKEPGNDKG
jgi:hypothetical protein